MQEITSCTKILAAQLLGGEEDLQLLCIARPLSESGMRDVDTVVREIKDKGHRASEVLILIGGNRHGIGRRISREKPRLPAGEQLPPHGAGPRLL